MSRVGKMPIQIPDGITIEREKNKIVVKGAKGILEEKVHPEMDIIIELIDTFQKENRPDGETKKLEDIEAFR